jgi:leucyl-tRNA---protein transferase
MNGFTFTTRPAPCPYLPDETQQLRYVEAVPALDRSSYMVLLRQGWRRFGSSAFRPECPACAACQSLRVPVDTFRPSDSQRRVWRKNHGDVEVRTAEPSWSPEREALLARFHQFGHETKRWAENSVGLHFFVDNPFRTEEWSYWLGERLIGVGYVDALAEALSAIYFFHDPDEHRRSLGTFNILTMIERAKQRHVPHVYLGYYVGGCRSLEYKRRFAPNELLGGGVWSPFAGPAAGGARECATQDANG